MEMLANQELTIFIVENTTYKKLLGKSNAALCISPVISIFSQTILANVVLRISFNWASVNRRFGSSVSYLQPIEPNVRNQTGRPNSKERQKLPESVAFTQLSELNANDTSKCWSN